MSPSRPVEYCPTMRPAAVREKSTGLRPWASGLPATLSKRAATGTPSARGIQSRTKWCRSAVRSTFPSLESRGESVALSPKTRGDGCFWCMRGGSEVGAKGSAPSCSGSTSTAGRRLSLMATGRPKLWLWALSNLRLCHCYNSAGRKLWRPCRFQSLKVAPLPHSTDPQPYGRRMGKFVPPSSARHPLEALGAADGC